MIDQDEISRRLYEKFEHVKVVLVGVCEDPVFFACNLEDKSFTLISTYMDSEIGGEFYLEENYTLTDVFGGFNTAQAEELRNDMITQIEQGNVVIVGEIDQRELH